MEYVRNSDLDQQGTQNCKENFRKISFESYYELSTDVNERENGRKKRFESPFSKYRLIPEVCADGSGLQANSVVFPLFIAVDVSFIRKQTLYAFFCTSHMPSEMEGEKRLPAILIKCEALHFFKGQEKDISVESRKSVLASVKLISTQDNLVFYLYITFFRTSDTNSM